jgi:hypothetical protein
MIVLRSISQIPEKIDELKMFYPSKREALQKVDATLLHFDKIARYRYTTESDFEIGQHIVLWQRLKYKLMLESEWEQPKVIEPSRLEKAISLIKQLPSEIIYYILNKFPKLFKTMLLKLRKKKEFLKKKNLI